MAIRGSSPVNVNLGMLDTRPAIQANAMVQQANVNLANSVNQAVNNFVQAKEKKENEQISINAIQSLLGITDPNLAKAIVKDPAVGKAFQFQREQQQLAADREMEVELAKIKAGDLTLGEQQRAEIKRLYPLMPNVIVDDIAAGRTIEDKDAEGNVIAVRSPSFGNQMIDYESYTGKPATPTETPTPAPTPTPSAVTPAQDVGSTEQGLFSEYFNLKKQGLSPFNFQTDVTGGIENVVEYFAGGSPIALDPKKRTFVQNLRNIKNTFLDGLREGDRYTVLEIKNIEKAFKNVIDPSTDTQFETAVPSATKYLKQLINRDEEKLKKNLNTAARIKIQDRIADLNFVVQQLGADQFAEQESIRTGLPINVKSEQELINKSLEALNKGGFEF
jgi:hypothetical protein